MKKIDTINFKGKKMVNNFLDIIANEIRSRNFEVKYVNVKNDNGTIDTYFCIRYKLLDSGIYKSLKYVDTFYLEVINRAEIYHEQAPCGFLSYKINKEQIFASACEIWDIFVRMELAIRMRERNGACYIDDVCTGSLLNLICGLYKHTLNPLMKKSMRKDINVRIGDLIKNEEELQEYSYDKKGIDENFKRMILDHSDETLYNMDDKHNIHPAILENYGKVIEVHGDWDIAYSITKNLIEHNIKFSLMNPIQFGYHEETSITSGLKDNDAYIVLFTMFILEENLSSYCHAYIESSIGLDNLCITEEYKKKLSEKGQLKLYIPVTLISQVFDEFYKYKIPLFYDKDAKLDSLEVPLITYPCYEESCSKALMEIFLKHLKESQIYSPEKEIEIDPKTNAYRDISKKGAKPYGRVYLDEVLRKKGTPLDIVKKL